MKTTIRLFITILPFLFLSAVGPKAKAVVPPPDGGYPGGNTAEGQNALFSLTTGTLNTAVGFFSLRSDMTGQCNTAIGAATLFANTADENTATGAGALLSNNTGDRNTANGALALYSNTTGRGNTAVGVDVLFNNTEGVANIAIGDSALGLNTTGDSNTALGVNALFGNTSGNENMALGRTALLSNHTGIQNTAIGFEALSANTSGSGNTVVGSGALPNNDTGDHNVVLGADAGGNIFGANNVICIGANLGGENVSNSCYIANIFNRTSSGGIAVFINSSGKLATMTSSQRFKDDVKPMEQTSETLYALKPVTFHYKKEIDPAGTSQMGLVAEDVEKVNPDLVVRDKKGKPYSVRYDQVNAMLLNEFLKEHRKMEQLERTVADLAARLQKVTAQMEMNKPAAQVALNRQ